MPKEKQYSLMEAFLAYVTPTPTKERGKIRVSIHLTLPCLQLERDKNNHSQKITLLHGLMRGGQMTNNNYLDQL